MSLLAGYIGQSSSSIIASGSAVSLTTATAANITSLSLPTGAWLVWGNVSFIPAATTTIGSVSAWNSSTSATQPDSSLYMANNYNSVALNATISCIAPMRIYNLSSTTTVYLSAEASFGTSTMTACGGLYAMEFAS